MNARSSFKSFLVLIAVALLVLLVSCKPDQQNRGPVSPVSTPLSIAQSPLATPECNPPWPTPPALACPWLPTPTPQPTSSWPTPVPWVPPTAPAQTPTPLPLREPAQNASGKLLFAVLLPPNVEPGPGRAPALYHATLNERAQLTSAPIKRQLPSSTMFGFARLSVSPDGHYLAGIDETEGGDVVYIINALTDRSVLTTSAGQFFGWHPNGYEILFRDDAAYQGLWLIDVRSDQRRLIAHQTTLDISGAAISPDGQRLVYGANTFTVHQIWTANADGSGPRLLLESNHIVYVFGWSPDGRYLLYSGEPTPPRGGKGTPVANLGGPLWVMDRNGQNRKSLKGPFIFGWGFEPIWSPANHRLAYVGADQLDACWQKDDTYRADPFCRFKGTAVFVEDVDVGEFHRVAANAIDPAWSLDGSRLAFSAMDEGNQIDIWIADTNGAELQRVTDTPNSDRYPIWAP